MAHHKGDVDPVADVQAGRQHVAGPLPRRHRRMLQEHVHVADLGQSLEHAQQRGGQATDAEHR